MNLNKNHTIYIYIYLFLFHNKENDKHKCIGGKFKNKLSPSFYHTISNTLMSLQLLIISLINQCIQFFSFQN